MTTNKRWALVDASGKNRGTCEAESRDQAAMKLQMKRYGKAEPVKFASGRWGLLPQGWSIVDRGPVEPAPEPAPEPTPAPEPRPFKVGDRVRIVATSGYSVGKLGVITGGPREHWAHVVKLDAGGEWGYHAHHLELVEPAPEPEPEPAPEPATVAITQEHYDAMVRDRDQAVRERDAVQARLTKARDNTALTLNNRVRDTVAWAIQDAASTVEAQADEAEQAAARAELPVPGSNSILRAAAARLREMSRNLYKQ